MKKSINVKEVVIATIIIILVFIVVEIFVIPRIEFKTIILQNKLERIMLSQNISPERFVINLHRMVKNIYYDSSMNSQDWNRWKYRYRGKIKTMEDAQIVVKTMLASLNDFYIDLLTPEALQNKKSILDYPKIDRTINYEITDDNVGIIKIYSILGKDTVEKFKDILIKTNNARAIVIDLRDNEGGILANALLMINYMVDKGEIIILQANSKSKNIIYSDGEKIFKTKPIYILINKKTASAAELFAGILKHKANAILVGEKSFGKNSIQQVLRVYNGYGLILTTHKYYFYNSHNNDIGLIPDIKSSSEISQ